MEIHPAARRHGVADEDIAHAITHHRFCANLDEDEPPWRVLYLGADRAGNLLEVVVVERDDGTELVIHTMKMRKAYEELLRPKRQDP